MKNKLFLTAILIAGLTFVSLQTNHLYGQTNQSKMTMKDTMKYTCPHHPDVISDKPEKCSCGMELVAMKPMRMKKDKMIDNADKMKEDGMHDTKGMKNKKLKKDSTMMKKEKM